MTSRKADVLILSSAIGSGHMRASAALTQGMKLLKPERVGLTVDFPYEVSPAVERLLRTAYLESLKLWPKGLRQDLPPLRERPPERLPGSPGEPGPRQR